MPKNYKRRHMTEPKYQEIKEAIANGKTPKQIQDWFLVSTATYSRVKATEDWPTYQARKKEWGHGKPKQQALPRSLHLPPAPADSFGVKNALATKSDVLEVYSQVMDLMALVRQVMAKVGASTPASNSELTTPVVQPRKARLFGRGGRS